MKIRAGLILLLFALRPFAAAEEGQADATPRITGVREWRTVDGKARRLGIARLSDDGKFVYLHDRKGKGMIPAIAVSSLVPEHRNLLARLHEGKLKLARVAGLSMELDFPSGKLADGYAFHLVGETREWSHSNGKKIAAQLINLTDDDVSLLVRGSVSRVALKDLSADDRGYVEQLMAGSKRLFVQSVDIGGSGWDGAPGYRLPVSGERYETLAAAAGDFERALEVAMKEVEAGLKDGDWEWESMEERDANPLPAYPGVAAAARVPRYYTATFFLSEKAYREARRRWPLTTTPEDWPGHKSLVIHVMADGECLPAVPERSSR